MNDFRVKLTNGQTFVVAPSQGQDDEFYIYLKGTQGEQDLFLVRCNPTDVTLFVRTDTSQDDFTDVFTINVPKEGE